MLVLAIIGFAVVQSAPMELEGQALVDYVNANSKMWTAALHNDFKLEDRVMSIAVSKMPVDKTKHKPPKIDIAQYIPRRSFDARTEWPSCSSISHIRDQSNCGSCWAVAAASVISDRSCIASQQKSDTYFSALDILSCCTGEYASGCNGGSTLVAFEFWMDTGVVTGTSYAENSGCKPYPFPSCGGTRDIHTVGNATVGARKTKCERNFATPQCELKCESPYQGKYFSDKSFGGSAYGLDADVNVIQQDIIENGPITASFVVYEDFRYYKSGVYKYTSGKLAGMHAVKIIGWGVENGVDYWLCANSWGPNWGDSGYVKIQRGINECDIESFVVGGTALKH